MTSQSQSLRDALKADRKVILTILIAALGYFVDIYDLVLFSVVRVASLNGLGIEGEAMMSTGALLLNMQLGGFLIGGLLWGVMGDRVGRKQVLFGSILLYSLANITNAFITTVDQYAICRLLAGVGLAGEIGAGITLVVELMPRHLRGYGTTFVAAVGVSGGMLAGFTGHMLDWQTAYIFGGCMGLLLLTLRVGVAESLMFKTARAQQHIKRGNLLLLFRNRKRFLRYMACILIGVPIWYVVGVIITFTPEIGRAMNIAEPLLVATALPLCYLGLTIGDLASGLISQKLQSRKKAIALFMVLSATGCASLLTSENISAWVYYAYCLLIGVFIGYWVLMLTTAAEQFGTDIRATVTTSVPNFVRATAVVSTSIFVSLKNQGVIESALYVGIGAFIIGFTALTFLKETFHADLDYIEADRQGL
ncbi:MAG: MFS transporter [Micavibrio aeruginosavorus]|uniref:MFS transporter n=1 Tax=Micavibrio aeruginosavorus TaxID=349221 RepID=A0A7T5R348_9BACT|nr:MAG: MFS transporter [Micavibrio aeruginosavorus]